MTWLASGSNRGGGWGSAPQFARVAVRYYASPGFRDRGLGLRLVRRCP